MSSRKWLIDYAGVLSSTSAEFMLQGLILVFLGIAVMLVPKLLVALVASTFIVIGGLFMVIAYKLKQFKNATRVAANETWEGF